MLFVLAAPASAQERCVAERSSEIIFSNPAHADTITARADGPACHQALLTLTLRDSEGRLLWHHASPYQGLATMGLQEFRDAPVSREAIEQFLARWIEPRRGTSSQAPEWTHGAASLQDVDVGGGTSWTRYDRSDYEAARASDVQMLCFDSGWEAAECIVMSQGGGVAFPLFGHGV